VRKEAASRDQNLVAAANGRTMERNLGRNQVCADCADDDDYRNLRLSAEAMSEGVVQGLPSGLGTMAAFEFAGPLGVGEGVLEVAAGGFVEGQCRGFAGGVGIGFDGSQPACSGGPIGRFLAGSGPGQECSLAGGDAAQIQAARTEFRRPIAADPAAAKLIEYGRQIVIKGQ
jgi:hypothetical protein